MFNPFFLLEVCGIQRPETQIPQSIKVLNFYFQETYVGKVGCAHMITCSSYYDYMYLLYSYKFRYLVSYPSTN